MVVSVFDPSLDPVVSNDRRFSFSPSSVTDNLSIYPRCIQDKTISRFIVFGHSIVSPVKLILSLTMTCSLTERPTTTEKEMGITDCVVTEPPL